MAEYIERGKLINCIESKCVDGKMWGNDEGELTLIDAYDTIDELMDIPAADVAPVRPGRWRWCGSDRYNDSFQCPECGK